MPNIAAVLKTEIARLARKEIKQQTTAMKQASGAYRREIAALKRRVQALEAALKRGSRGRPAAAEAAAGDEADGSAPRFSAKGLASQRKRLGLSAADFGRLIGASALSVYKWEQGKSRPRAKSLAAIAAVRGIGKREVARRLAEA